MTDFIPTDPDVLAVTSRLDTVIALLRGDYAPPVVIIPPEVVMPPAPAPATVPVPSPSPAPLPPLDLKACLVSTWSDGAAHSAACKADHVNALAAGDVTLLLDKNGEAELQTKATYDTGIFEFDLTVPTMRDGQIAAAFLYNKNGDEIDFEVVGKKGLQLACHVGGKQVTFWPAGYQGDLSGKRIKGMMTVRKGSSVDWELDGAHVWGLTPATGPAGKLTSSAMHFMFSNWGYKTGPANWAGTWKPMADGEASTLLVHGFGVTQV